MNDLAILDLEDYSSSRNTTIAAISSIRYLSLATSSSATEHINYNLLFLIVRSVPEREVADTILVVRIGAASFVPGKFSSLSQIALDFIDSSDEVLE